MLDDREIQHMDRLVDAFVRQVQEIYNLGSEEEAEREIRARLDWRNVQRGGDNGKAQEAVQ